MEIKKYKNTLFLIKLEFATKILIMLCLLAFPLFYSPHSHAQRTVLFKQALNNFNRSTAGLLQTGQILGISIFSSDPYSSIIFELMTGSRYSHIGIIQRDDHDHKIYVYEGTPPHAKKLH